MSHCGSISYYSQLNTILETVRLYVLVPNSPPPSLKGVFFSLLSRKTVSGQIHILFYKYNNVQERSLKILLIFHFHF
jgi:hypothetical protein